TNARRAHVERDVGRTGASARDHREEARHLRADLREGLVGEVSAAPRAFGPLLAEIGLERGGLGRRIAVAAGGLALVRRGLWRDERERSLGVIACARERLGHD